MPDIGLYVLLVVALGLGYLLGRRDRRKRAPRSSVDGAGSVSAHYYEGLSHLINERPDLAIDSFLEGMDVSDDSVDAHLAMGALVRRRGEVDKAIRIHQNLLARPVLSLPNRERAELELARDYLAAGLLGRAENLLRELSRKSRTLKSVSLGHLLEVYQQEREWELAIEVGTQLARGDNQVRTRIAQFHCELAEAELESGNLRETRRRLANARRWDGSTPRVNLLAARVALEARRFKEAKKHLHRLVESQPLFVQETLDLYRQACVEGNDEADYERYLHKCLERSPAVSVVAELARYIESAKGPKEAWQFVAEQLLRRPSARGFLELLKRLESQGESGMQSQIHLLERFTERLLEGTAGYQCKNCGFEGRNLSWHCPSCHNWGTILPKQGDERALA